MTRCMVVVVVGCSAPLLGPALIHSLIYSLMSITMGCGWLVSRYTSTRHMTRVGGRGLQKSGCGL